MCDGPVDVGEPVDQAVGVEDGLLARLERVIEVDEGGPDEGGEGVEMGNCGFIEFVGGEEVQVWSVEGGGGGW